MTSDEIIFEPIRLDFLSKVELQIQKVSLIKEKIFAVSNRSYVIGENFIAEWGSKVFKKDERQPNELEVIHIKANELGLGANYTFAYTVKNETMKNNSEKGQVFCWGSNKNYELGLEEEKEYELNEVGIFDEALDAGFKLLQISCGENHTLALLGDEESGETKLFGWGESKSYQLALDTTSIVPYPVDIEYEFTSSIKKNYSKSDYNIALTNEGELYSWGSNLFNRLGVNSSKINKISPSNSNKCEEDRITERRPSFIENLNSNVQKVKIPRKIHFDNKKINSVALGTYHVVALTIEGSCITWGNGIYGQLGNNKYGECPPEEIFINHLQKNVKFTVCVAGEHHSCLLDTEGNLYSCGSNSYGVLGHEKHENQTKKKRCKIFEKITFFSENNIRIKEIACGDRHCLALSSANQTYGWGSNKLNQILTKESENELESSPEFHSQIIRNEVNHFEKIDSENNLKSEKCYKKSIKEKINESEELPNKNCKQIEILKEKIMFSKDKIQWEKMKEWKKRYTEFLIKKRQEEDLFMKELDQLMSFENESS